MNKTLLPLLLLPLTAQAETPAAPVKVVAAPVAPTLAAGSKVTPAIFAKLDWIQGVAPVAWEPGAVYIFECWATWCGPCVANIPHVNELYKKYGAKGLRVYGIDVWEDGRDKVAAFVQKKGDGMAYPVAYTGKGSVFETEWLKAGGVRGIPHAFVVKDGEIVLMAHPAELTETVIEGLLSGKDGRTKALATLSADRAKKQEFNRKYVAVNNALRSGDIPAVETALVAMKAVGIEDDRIPAMEIRLSILKKDWVTAGTQLDAMPDSVYRAMNLQEIVRAVADNKDADKNFAAKALAAFQPLVEKIDSPVDWQIVMKIRWRIDDKTAAIEAAKRALAAAKLERNVRVGFDAAPYEKIVASLEAGILPDDATVIAWNREAFAARKAAVKK